MARNEEGGGCRGRRKKKETLEGTKGRTDKGGSLQSDREHTRPLPLRLPVFFFSPLLKSKSKSKSKSDISELGTWGVSYARTVVFVKLPFAWVKGRWCVGRSSSESEMPLCEPAI